jgi:hypothetical protein
MNAPKTTLRQPWLNIARALWILFASFAVGIGIIGTVVYSEAGPPDCTAQEAAPNACGPWAWTRQDMELAQALGLSHSFLQAMVLFQSVFPKVFFALVALLIFLRKSDDWVALILSLMLIGFFLEGVTEAGALTPLANVLYAGVTLLFALLPFIFPNGQFVPRWMGWLVPPLIAAQLIAVNLPSLGIPATEPVYIFSILLAFAVWFLFGGYSAVYRYRRVSTGVERQQTKWVVAGILGTFLLFIPFTVIGIWYPPSKPSAERLAFYLFFFTPFYYVAYLFMPVAIAVAVFRYRLWDIDIIIRRTVTYTMLAALLSLVFFGSIILLQQLFASVSGQRSEVITVLSTLAIAALFVPLRNRIQELIDRRFYRRKYDAQKVLSDFSNTVRDETDLEKLTERLMQVVDETMQPKSVSLWLLRERRANRE